MSRNAHLGIGVFRWLARVRFGKSSMWSARRAAWLCCLLRQTGYFCWAFIDMFTALCMSSMYVGTQFWKPSKYSAYYLQFASIGRFVTTLNH